jgi:tRNA G10  N-methylase Trm11
MKTLCILGRQPALGLAELESLFGSDSIQPVADQAAMLNLAATEVPFTRLGGTIKLCGVITTIPSIDPATLFAHIINSAPHHADMLPEGKLKIGLSAYGLPISPSRLNAAGLELKRALRASGRSVRIVPNKEPALNSAQVLHNKLTDQLGWEIVFVRNGHETILAQTIAVQDIEAYAARDQARPKRDARVGMLPPKLAQIIINLAVDGTNSKHGSVVLDPFCGTGVILQEATLMGFDVYGTDLDERMVSFTQENLMWLAAQPWSNIVIRNDQGAFCPLEAVDATSHKWSPLPNFIAAETYLGRPFSSEPKPEILQEVIQDVDTIHRKFLKNVARQTTTGFRMCIAVPAWQSPYGFKHLPVLDHLTEMGYNRVSFAHASDKDLIYYRPNQVVGRELVTLVRK